MSIQKILHTPAPAMLLALGFGLWGLGWGLPSQARTNLFLKPEQQTPEFYEKVSKSRDDYYEKMGVNPMAYVGRVARVGKEAQTATLTLDSSYSSFMIRTHHGDEQANLVMLSHLNPLHGKWYPYTYAYGGVYVYSLATFLGVLHLFHVIHLDPHVVFYYAHPEEIAKVFYAARAWTVIALMLSIIPLFYIARRLAGDRVAFWATIFYALLPATIGNSKMAKPHIWASLWMLCCIYNCIRFSEEDDLRLWIGATVSFGLALGTTLSQMAFTPFLIWAAWRPSFSRTMKRLIPGGLLTLAVFLLSNFYIFVHFQDFMDEWYFLRNYSPFGVSFKALWDFGVWVMMYSLGTGLWIFAMLAGLYAVWQKSEGKIRQVMAVCWVIFIYVSFQVQAQHGLAPSSRLFMALLGVWCVITVWALESVRWNSLIYGVILVLLLAQAVVYDLHFAADRVPYDNATRAALWIKDNIPPGSVIGQGQVVPHVTEFPPVDFTKYKIEPISDAKFFENHGKVWAVLPPWMVTPREILFKHGFKMIKTFAESPLQKLGTDDQFTTADFAVIVYYRDTP